MKNGKLYCCFSLPLRDFLMEHGEKYELVAKNPSNDKTMWIFIKTAHLRELLGEWTKNRPN